jgi:tyrosine-protein kinase Etk/Wzc
VPVTGPDEGGASAGAEAFAQRIALQVKLETLLRTESESSEDVGRTRAQLEALGGELSRLPEAGTEMARLLREVKIQDQVYILLTAQDEEAKVREHKDTPTVQILDRAETPERKSRPRRSLIVVTAVILGLGESCLWALYLDRGRARMRPAPRA